MRSGIAQAAPAGKRVLVHEPYQEPRERSSAAFAHTLANLGRNSGRVFYDHAPQTPS
jgi:hypothetical protein